MALGQVGLDLQQGARHVVVGRHDDQAVEIVRPRPVGDFTRIADGVFRLESEIDAAIIETLGALGQFQQFRALDLGIDARNQHARALAQFQEAHAFAQAGVRGAGQHDDGVGGLFRFGGRRGIDHPVGEENESQHPKKHNHTDGDQAPHALRFFLREGVG